MHSAPKKLPTFLQLTLISLLVMTNAYAVRLKVIYGEDNRVDAQDASTFYQTLAESTVALISNSNIQTGEDGVVTLSAPSLEDQGVCESEAFSQQKTAARCSGFLVSPTHIVTAGHCVRSQSSCESQSFVFNYKMDGDEVGEIIASEDVFSCKTLVASVLDSTTQSDYALIELDRAVEGREPLNWRSQGKVAEGSELVVIGHPSGLPTKVADGAIVRDNSNDVFLVSNLDTYGGNSGSAVLNATTGIVEGILVRGEVDYVFDPVNNCRISNRVGNSEGRGEDVTLITQVKELDSITEEPDQNDPPKKPGRGRGIPRWFWLLFGR